MRGRGHEPFRAPPPPGLQELGGRAPRPVLGRLPPPLRGGGRPCQVLLSLLCASVPLWRKRTSTGPCPMTTPLPSTVLFPDSAPKTCDQ